MSNASRRVLLLGAPPGSSQGLGLGFWFRGLGFRNKGFRGLGARV